jgi:hypothetical protein
MSNTCLNGLTIQFSSENHLRDFVSEYLDNYAGANDKKIVSRGTRGIITTCYTQAEPDFEWLEKILRDNPKCCIHNDWNDYVRNVAGVWIGRWNESNREGDPEDQSEFLIHQMQWKDISAEDRATLFGWRQGQAAGLVQEQREGNE